VKQLTDKQKGTVKTVPFLALSEHFASKGNVCPTLVGEDDRRFIT
jgi:hypothetical protein